MPVIGITGGVATGKSLFLQELLKAAPAAYFDADRYVHALLDGNAEVLAELQATFPDHGFVVYGRLDRVRLRELVFNDAEARLALEAIIHPRVQRAWLKEADQCRQSGALFYADIPLLFETALDRHVDRIIAVASSGHAQRERMRTQRGLAPEMIERMIAAQLDLAVKVARADHLIWNDSTPALVEEQARLVAAWLRQRYG